MASISDKELALARVYSSAMIELASQTGDTRSLAEELADLAAHLDHDPGFDRFLSSPTVDPESRRVVLEKLFRGRYSDLCVDSLQVMNRKDRLGLIRAVAQTYHVLDEERRNRVEVFVRTAVEMTGDLRAGLKEVVKAKTGKEVDLVESLDESLVAGMIVRVGDQQYDMSAATKLRTIRESLMERASREMVAGRHFIEGQAV